VWYDLGLLGLVLTFAVCMLAGILMVSGIPYPSIKQIDWNARMKFFYFVIVPISLALVAAEPPIMLLVLFSIYVSLAPVMFVIRRLRRAG
jgi:CDP-diacylglycerol--serine O-phosphatidyltransferase